MQLSFVKTHLSITSFPIAILPDFTLITGLNGAGKSHLLQAILSGAVATDVATPNTPTQDIRLFDWNSLVPQDTGAFASESLRQESENLRNNLTSWKQHGQAAEPLREIARRYNLGQQYIDNPYRLALLSNSDAIKVFSSLADVSQVMEEIRSAANTSSNWILQQNDENARAILMAASAIRKRPIALLEARDLESGIPNWGRTDLFQQSFARLFVAYRDMQLSNMIAELQASKGHEKVSFLNEAEFIERSGPAPWKFVNDTIKSAGLDFSINNPDQYSFSMYTPQLTKISTGIVIPFSSLSSGEKILMSFAFCVYYANDRRQLAVYPKLLLFDEIDAPLHPSMTKSLVNTITGTLVREFGIKVIATTHSPSTVALSPSDAVHLMRPGQPGLKQVGKSEALNILTTGVPTLAISYDGRRQVFVESPSDAKTYDALYKIFKSELPSERSLEFVATGTRSASGSEKNTGCDVVRRLVSELVSSGNQSVFGLIDHDGQHEDSGRMVVVGGGERNGLENFLFDPAMLAALVCRDCSQNKAEIGMDESVSYPKFLASTPSEIQVYLDAICDKVFGGLGPRVEAEYHGGFSMLLDERWLTEDDHALEARILNAFPFLNSITKQQAGRFMQHILATVASDTPKLVPKALVNTLRDLLDREAHI